MFESENQTKNCRILIVEDDAANLQVIANCLADDYQLSIAKTRKKTMELLSQKEFDLLLLDIKLPDGNGFDICSKIKSSNLPYREISIIFMTALDTPEDEAMGLKLGACDYIQKPINCTVLKARVDIQAQLIRKTKLLERLANLDGLTEIPNRRAFDNQLNVEWNRAKRKKQSIALAMLDIDYFKQFNDYYGHLMGDVCLKKLAWSLSQSFQRASDFSARYGGEEFAIILPDTALEDADKILKLALKQFINLGLEHKNSKVSDTVTFSAGLVLAFPDESISCTDLIEAADKLLYRAKSQGRNQICSSLFSVNFTFD